MFNNVNQFCKVCIATGTHNVVDDVMYNNYYNYSSVYLWQTSFLLTVTDIHPSTDKTL